MSESSYRGIEEAQQVMKDQGFLKQEEVSQEVVQQGKELLTALSKHMPTEPVTDDQMTQILTALISNTEFSSARVESQDYQSTYLQMDIFSQMYVTVGVSRLGSGFNVWFARVSNSWVLKYSRVPSLGNLRGA